MGIGRLLGGIPFKKLILLFKLEVIILLCACQLFEQRSVKSTFYGAVNNESRFQFYFRFPFCHSKQYCDEA